MMSKIEVRNPRTGVIDFWIEPPSGAELSATSTSLRGAQSDWETGGLETRAGALLEWKKAIEARRDAIVSALVADTGRRTESELEVGAVGSLIERWCELGKTLLAEEPPRASSVPGVGVQQTLRPYPLVGVISPWNFPLLLSLIDAIPALVAGCAVMVKPSEVTPRFVEPLMESISAVPAVKAVLAYLTGGPETGSELIDQVDAICFTGSVPTGRKVAAQAASRFIPAFLELGGKDPAVVLSSADLDRASSAILWGSTANAGQACQSIERVYVDSSIAEPFIEMLVEKAKKVTLATSSPESGEIGPIIAEKQIAIIREQLRDAIDRGAEVRCGGEIMTVDGGSYLPPTVITNVDRSMKLMTEETFGPIIPVMTFNDPDEAVSFANDTIYGLSAAVFAGESEEAIDVARRINAGAVSINDASLTAIVYDAEKNSFNLSGMGGSRMGPAALRRFGRRQAFLVSESTHPDPWWHRSITSDNEDRISHK